MADAAHWVEEDWRKFAALALHAAGTDVARARGWSETFYHVARDAVDLAIEMNQNMAALGTLKPSSATATPEKP